MPVRATRINAAEAPTPQTVEQTIGMPLAGAPCLIERQFPVARVSAESFKERTSKQSQTLTGLGKWWGRKPLVLVRATILGLLLPATHNSGKDREIFLKLMTMDEEGLRRRKYKKLEDDVIRACATDEERRDYFQAHTPDWRSDYETAWALLPFSERDELFQSEPNRTASGVRQGPRKKDTQERQRRIRCCAAQFRNELEARAFVRLPYSQKLTYCRRPEYLDGPSAEAWTEINAHLGTNAKTLSELVEELGKRRFGHRARVGDSFCGAGSIPFEAARIGCDAYGSDLSPVAALLTWAALNIVGGGEEVARRIREAQRQVYAAVDQQVTEWRVEHNDRGWRADAYLYCVEATCPECGWRVPLAPSWLVGAKTNTVAELVADPALCRFDIEIHEGVSAQRVVRAKKEAGTVRDSRLYCPRCGPDKTTEIDALRRLARNKDPNAHYHESGLRLWENDDLVPRPGDVFQERLYCIRWVLPNLEDALCLEQMPEHPFGTRLRRRWRAEPGMVVEGLLAVIDGRIRDAVTSARNSSWPAAAAAILSAKADMEALAEDSDSDSSERLGAVQALGRARKLLPMTASPIVGISNAMASQAYCAPDPNDAQRDERVFALMRDRLHAWQRSGFIPSRRIEPGAKTNEPIRTRGWTHWHQLFAPRQLLVTGPLLEQIATACNDRSAKCACLLGISRAADYNARLSRWHPRLIGDKTEQVFSNQALNTLWNYAARATSAIDEAFLLGLKAEQVSNGRSVGPADARHVAHHCDIWITDPPYADAVNYHELSEFFLAWYERHLPQLFPKWYTDSKRALAVKAEDPIDFKVSMVACYRRLVEQMADDGLQVVMFTHQDAAVWADLTMILWAAGLRVTAAWCIATETDSALKEGNYVQGTVLLVCRKRTDVEPVFLDEINFRIEVEVRRQLDEMVAMEDTSEPNFADADYQLAAYAAALRVLTERPIEEIDPEREITRVRRKGETSPVEQLIRNAVKIACDHLVPRGIDGEMWKTLSPMERFYLKGLEVETHGEHRSGVYQELARGFGAANYDDLFASTKANETRLMTAGEFGKKDLAGTGFGASLVRQALFAVHQVERSQEPGKGLNWLRTEITDYWPMREKSVHILDYLAALGRVTGLGH